MEMVVFKRVLELKFSVLMDKVNRYRHEVTCRERSFMAEGSMVSRHKSLAETPSGLLAASSKAVAPLIWPVWSCKESFKMYL